MKNFDYKISYLELVGELFTGAAVIMIVKHGEDSYEALFWISPDVEKVEDRFVMPREFLEKEGIEKTKQHEQYKNFIKESWKVIPGNRQSILKEVIK